MTRRTITEDIDGARAGDELAQLRMLVRQLSNQILCIALLDERRTALMAAEQIHLNLAIGAETMRASVALAKSAITFVDGPTGA